MTDDKGSKIGGVVQEPPTGRPLTAGDANAIAEVAWNTARALSASEEEDDSGPWPPAAGLYSWQKDDSEYCRAVEIAKAEAFLAAFFRPAASDEGAGRALKELRFLANLERNTDRLGSVMIANWIIQDLAALASPPVSERERELEGALLEMVGVVRAAGVGNLMNGVQLGQVAWGVKATDALARSDLALTAQPAGEPTHG